MPPPEWWLHYLHGSCNHTLAIFCCVVQVPFNCLPAFELTLSRYKACPCLQSANAFTCRVRHPPDILIAANCCVMQPVDLVLPLPCGTAACDERGPLALQSTPSSSNSTSNINHGAHHNHGRAHHNNGGAHHNHSGAYHNHG